jgi:hypothetical protein
MVITLTSRDLFQNKGKSLTAWTSGVCWQKNLKTFCHNGQFPNTVITVINKFVKTHQYTRNLYHGKSSVNVKPYTSVWTAWNFAFTDTTQLLEDGSFVGYCSVQSSKVCRRFGGSKHLWNDGKLLPDYTAQQPSRQPCSYSPPREPEISP